MLVLGSTNDDKGAGIAENEEYEYKKWMRNHQNVAQMLSDVSVLTSIDIDPVTAEGLNNLENIYPILYRMKANENLWDPSDRSIVETCKAQSCICNVLISSRIMALECHTNIAYCTTVLGSYFFNITENYSINRTEYRKEKYRGTDFEHLEENFRKAFDGRIEILDTIMIPILHGGNHWALIVTTVEQRGEQIQEHVWWGDSPDYKHPVHVLPPFQALYDYCVQSDGSQITYNENYMIKFLHYEPQLDSYSCGASVVLHFLMLLKTKESFPSKHFLLVTALCLPRSICGLVLNRFRLELFNFRKDGNPRNAFLSLMFFCFYWDKYLTAVTMNGQRKYIQVVQVSRTCL